MPISVSEKTINTLLQRLGLKCPVDVMDLDFQDIDEEHDVDREKASLYASRNRGSVRINTGRYYTAKEYRDRVRHVKNLRLPK